jgi:hypothetical protein
MYNFTTIDQLAKDMGPGWEVAGPGMVKKGKASITYDGPKSYLCTVHLGSILDAHYGQTPSEALISVRKNIMKKRDDANTVIDLLTNDRHELLVKIAEGAAAQERHEKVLENW